MNIQENILKKISQKSSIETKRKTKDVKSREFSKVVKLLSKTTLYKSEVSFKFPPLRTKIDYKSFFNVEDEKLRGLISNPYIDNFVEINRITTKLQYLKKKIYKQMVYCDPFGWVLAEESIEDLMREINNLKNYFAKIPLLVDECYERDFLIFIKKIVNIGKNLEFEEEHTLKLLNVYGDNYPDKEEIIEKFNLTIFYPEKLPEILDVVKHQNEILDLKLEQERLNLQQKNQLAYYQALNEGIEHVKNELFESISKILNSLNKETVVPGKLNLNTEKSILKVTKEIEKYLNWDENLETLLEEVNVLHSTATDQKSSKDNLISKVEQIKDKLFKEYQYSVEETQDTGHRSIPKSLRKNRSKNGVNR